MSIRLRLYKYFPPERIDVLENFKVRFTPPLYFNDPFDCLPTFNGMKASSFNKNKLLGMFEDKIESAYLDYCKLTNDPMHLDDYRKLLFSQDLWGKFLKFDTEIAEKARMAFTKDILPRMAVFCLSEAFDNKLMWSHYADSHKGFCIEFDAEHDFFEQKHLKNKRFAGLRKVIYSKEKVSNFEEVWNDPHSLYSNKCEDWAYEKEWRLVDYTENCDSKITLNSGECIHLFGVPKESILSVTFGLKASEHLKRKILNSLQINSMDKVKKFQLEISSSTYELIACELF